MEIKSLVEVGVKDLTDRGLTQHDIESLGLQVLSNARVELDSSLKPLPCIKIPYPTTKPPFFRVRYLGASGNGKYGQPTGSESRLYLHGRILESHVRNETSQDICITEGEFKAIALNKLGFPAIGISGVWSFSDRYNETGMVDDFKYIKLRKRKVYVVFDSDVATNLQVQKAMNMLCLRLSQLGAIPIPVISPKTDTGLKTGIDDWLLGIKAEDRVANMLELLKESLDNECLDSDGSAGRVASFRAMNAKYVVVLKDLVVVMPRHQGDLVWTLQSFKNNASTETYMLSTSKNGTEIQKQVRTAPEWAVWSGRNQVDEFTYAPGKGKFPIIDDVQCYNIWSPLTTIPIEGDVTLFLELLDNLFSSDSGENENEGAKRWLLQWLAYPLQHAGAKLHSAVMLHGTQTGTGKSLLGDTMRAIYGKNSYSLTNENLSSRFNEWAKNCQFAQGDEVDSIYNREFANKLKGMITSPVVNIEEKGLPTYTIKNYINYYLTSNHPNALKLDKYDRRLFVHETSMRKVEEAWAKKYGKWIDEGNGAGIVLWYLLNKIDTSSFNPKAEAYRTVSRDKMIENTKTDLSLFLDDLLSNSSVFGVKSNKDLYQSTEIYNILPDNIKRKTSVTKVGTEMSQLGYRQVLGGKLIKIDGAYGRYFVLRNVEEWKKCTNVETVVNHIKEYNKTAFEEDIPF